MEAYREQNWQEAASRLGEMLTHFPDDGPNADFYGSSVGVHSECTGSRLGRGLRHEDKVGRVPILTISHCVPWPRSVVEAVTLISADDAPSLFF